METPKEPDDRGASGSEVKEEDAFSSAFDEKIGVDTPAEKPETPATETPEKEVPPAEKAEAGDKVEKAEKPKESEEETYVHKYKTLQGIHKHDKETWEQEKTKLLADLEAAKAEKKEPPKSREEQVEKAEEFEDGLTQDEKAELNSYEEEFDVVSKMEGIKRKREMKKLETKISDWMKKIEERLTATQTSIESKIEPATKMVAEREREAHFAAIKEGYTREDGTHVAGHADFRKYVDDGSIVKWIETKPKYMQTALMQTYKSGSAEDAIDMLTDFKTENGIEIITPAPGAKSDDKVVSIDRKADKKKALKDVDNRPVAVNSGKGIADDYEGAFDEAAKKRSAGG